MPPSPPTQRHTDYRKGLAITAIGGFLLTFDTPLLRLADAGPWVAMFWRGILAFTVITGYWLVLRMVTGRKIPLINGRVGLVVSILFGTANIFFITALHNTTVANLVFILALAPLLTAGFSFVFLGERVTRGTLVSIMLAILGVGIIVSDGIAQGSAFGDLLALCATSCVSAALTVSRGSGKDMSLTPGPAAFMGAMFALIFADSLALTPQQFGYLAVNGALVMPLSTVLLALGPRYIPAAEVAMFILLETVLAPIWVWLVVSEVPSSHSLIGGAIIITTLAGHSLSRLLRRNTQSAQQS